MARWFDAAIALADEKANKKQPAIGESKSRTRAFAIFAALVANEHDPRNPEWLRLARLYSDQLGDEMSKLLKRGSLEVARRAHRVKQPPPIGLEGVLLEEWQELWKRRDPTAAS